MKNITKDEYYEWITSSRWVSNGEMFTSCCGPHSFSDIISKDGILYSLSHGWDVEKETDPNSTYTCKNVYWWGIKTLQMDDGQLGDGI